MNDKKQHIRMRAYEIWQREGYSDGRAEDHWHQAEAELRADFVKSSKQEPKAMTPDKHFLLSATYVPLVAAVITAILGFAGVICTLLWNAHQARVAEQNRCRS